MVLAAAGIATAGYLGWKNQARINHHYRAPGSDEITVEHGTARSEFPSGYEYTGYRDNDGNYILKKTDEQKRADAKAQQQDLQNKQSAAMEEYYGVATQAAREQMARATELWNVYKNEYLPGELAWAKESYAGIPTDPELAWASHDVGRSYDKAIGIQERNLERMGINPASPQYQALQANYGIARSAAEAGARNQARRNIRDVNYERRRQAVAMGKGIPATASGITAQGAGMFGQAAGGLANVYGQQSGQMFQAEQAALGRDFASEQAHRDRKAAATANVWGAVADIISGGLGALGTYYGMKDDSSSSTETIQSGLNGN